MNDTPATVIANARDAFRRFSIPIERADELFGVIESGRFAVWDGWGGEPLENRVACAGADAHTSVIPDSVTPDIELEADRRPGRPALAAVRRSPDLRVDFGV